MGGFSKGCCKDLNILVGYRLMTLNETDWQKYYPDVKPRYNIGGGSAYGDPDKNVTKFFDPLLPGSWVLDVGVGDGKYGLELLGRGMKVVGGDIDAESLDVLRKKARRAYGNLRLIKFDAFGKEFPFRDESLDVVVSTGLLYLFPEVMVQRVVDESRRVLRPGGRLIFDFATEIERRGFDGRLIRGATEVDYKLNEGVSLVKRVLADGFEPYSLSFTPVEQKLPSYKMKNIKLNISVQKSGR